MPIYKPIRDPRVTLETRVEKLSEEIAGSYTGNGVQICVTELGILALKFREGEVGSESVSRQIMEYYWLNERRIHSTSAGFNLVNLGFDFGNDAGIPLDDLSEMWAEVSEKYRHHHIR